MLYPEFYHFVIIKWSSNFFLNISFKLNNMKTKNVKIAFQLTNTSN